MSMLLRRGEEPADLLRVQCSGGRQGVMGWLAKRKVRFVAGKSGRLVASVPGDFPGDPVARVLTAYARLLPAWAAGKDEPCDLCDKPAVAPALPDAVVCEEHVA